MIGIYKIVSPSRRIYIGQSIDIERRFAKYKRYSHCKKQIRLHSSLIKYGSENHLFEVIEECAIDELNNRERFWQDYYDVLSKKGLNCMLTKSSDKSGKSSPESVEKMKAKLKGVKRKPHTEESKIKISLAIKGKKRTEEAKANMRKAFANRMPTFGYKHTEEAKRKISELTKGNKRNLGRKHTLANRIMWAEVSAISQGKMVLNMETGIYYPALSQAAKIINVHYSHLARMLKGDRKNVTSFIYV